MSNQAETKPIIEFAGIEFHDPSIVPPITLFEDPVQFGIMKLNIRGDIPILQKHLHILFTVDCSGSMSDLCKDNRTKMQHILHTLENMLRVFYEKPGTDISIHVQAFDTKIIDVIKDVPDIKAADIEELVQKIKTIRPRGSTDIGLALERASVHFQEYKQEKQEQHLTDLVHIFLTDGEITQGERNVAILQTLVPCDVSNVFIGYGKDHDSKLLSQLGINNDYRFVDALEKAGLVYGEVIHNLLYKAIEDVTIQTHNCEIYDFWSNTWNTSLHVGNLVSEQNKLYHIRRKINITGAEYHYELNKEATGPVPESDIIALFHNKKINEDTLVWNSNMIDWSPLKSTDLWPVVRQSVSVLGRTIGKTKQEQEQEQDKELLVEIFITNDMVNNLSKHIFRQRTQELLYRSRQLSEKSNYTLPLFSSYFSNIKDLSNIKEERVTEKEKLQVKTDLNNFLKLMIQYSKDHQLEEDTFIKMLCDDIYIAYKTLGTRFANMFTCARQITQGRQYIYTCSTIDDIDENEIKMINADLKTRDDINYTISNGVLSPFSSDGAVETMREISQSADVDFETLTHRS